MKIRNDLVSVSGHLEKMNVLMDRRIETRKRKEV